MLTGRQLPKSAIVFCHDSVRVARGADTGSLQRRGAQLIAPRRSGHRAGDDHHCTRGRVLVPVPVAEEGEGSCSVVVRDIRRPIRIRLLAKTRTVPFIFDPTPRVFWDYLVAIITYIIILPVPLFLQYIVPSWKRALRALVIFGAVWAALEIGVDVAFRRPHLATNYNSFLVIVIISVFGVAIFRQMEDSETTRWLRYALVLNFLAVISVNLSGILVLQRIRS